MTCMHSLVVARWPAVAAALGLLVGSVAGAQTPPTDAAGNGAPVGAPVGAPGGAPGGAGGSRSGPPPGMGNAGSCSANAGLPQAGELMGKGSTRRSTPNPNGEPPAAPAAARNQVQQHVAQLQAALQLSADQQQYWDSYQEMVAVLSRDRNQAAQFAAKAADPATPMPERMQARIQTLATQCNTLNRMSQQIVLLYDHLTPEQQKIANRLDLDPSAKGE
ncbi:MAG: hypothetical protein QM718_15415 [Steroidobacteraceae bacterium]